jgi:hypothetical protein
VPVAVDERVSENGSDPSISQTPEFIKGEGEVVEAVIGDTVQFLLLPSGSDPTAA